MFSTLQSIATHVEGRETTAAEAALAALLSRLGDRHDPDALQARIFAGAMARTLDLSVAAEANLYLRSFEVAQIQLFGLLARAVPVVSEARRVAEKMLLDHLTGHEEVILLDIGIGSGTQEAALLTALAHHPARPRKVVVYGVEVSAESLEVADENLTAAVADTDRQLDFRKIPMGADDLSEAWWQELAASPLPKVAMSSFALHHLAPRDGQEGRDLVLRRMRTAGVGAFVLIEPDSNHLQHAYVGRFEQAWRHFGAVFRLLDTLDITASEASALKAMFFGREIADILGTLDGDRAERHEDHTTWRRRLSAAGFSLPRPTVRPPLRSSPHLDTRVHESHVAIGHAGTDIVAVFCAI